MASPDMAKPGVGKPEELSVTVKDKLRRKQLVFENGKLYIPSETAQRILNKKKSLNQLYGEVFDGSKPLLISKIIYTEDVEISYIFIETLPEVNREKIETLMELIRYDAFAT